MPRAFKKDRVTTKLLHENKLLLDRDSFASLGIPPHLILFGLDLKLQRERAWVKSKGKCFFCKREIWNSGDFELHHLQGGTSGRCDCLHNVVCACADCHRQQHVHPRWGEGRAEAIKDFEKVME